MDSWSWNPVEYIALSCSQVSCEIAIEDRLIVFE